jgi:hypothetical protein
VDPNDDEDQAVKDEEKKAGHRVRARSSIAGHSPCGTFPAA